MFTDAQFIAQLFPGTQRPPRPPSRRREQCDLGPDALDEYRSFELDSGAGSTVRNLKHMAKALWPYGFDAKRLDRLREE